MPYEDRRQETEHQSEHYAGMMDVMYCLVDKVEEITPRVRELETSRPHESVCHRIPPSGKSGMKWPIFFNTEHGEYTTEDKFRDVS